MKPEEIASRSRSMKKMLLSQLILVLVVIYMGTVAFSCAKTEPPQSPTPYMPSDRYRFTPPYSARFDLESLKGFDCTETGAEYPSYKWSDALKNKYPVLKRYAELPQTEYLCILLRSNSGIATLVLTSTFDEDFDISIKATLGEWSSSNTPERIRVVPSSDVTHLKSRGQGSLNFTVETDDKTPPGLYFVTVAANIEGYRSETVLWLLVIPQDS